MGHEATIVGMTKKPLPAFILGYSDSDFTNPHEMVLPDEPPSLVGNYTHMGAQYWGLETRRHRTTRLNRAADSFSYDHSSHNWVDIALKGRFVVDEIRISTKWFTGNQVRAASVILHDELHNSSAEVLTRVALNPDSEHSFPIKPTVATGCRVELYHEGGMSRINFFGSPADEQPPERENLLTSAKISHVSNEHYGHPSKAVAGVRKEMHMVGWESARTGYGESALFHLTTPCIPEMLIVDTYMHRLNSPLSSHLFGFSGSDGEVEAAMANRPRWKLRFGNGHEIIPEDFQTYMVNEQFLQESAESPHSFTILLHNPGPPWIPLIPFAPLERDTYHQFPIPKIEAPITHLLYMHYPNGGIHGLKLYGLKP